MKSSRKFGDNCYRRRAVEEAVSLSGERANTGRAGSASEYMKGRLVLAGFSAVQWNEPIE